MRAFPVQQEEWLALRPLLDEQRERCESELLDDICTALVTLWQRESDNANEAWMQLDAGTYGYCLDCRAAIPLDRLETTEFAVRCVTCAREHVRGDVDDDRAPSSSLAHMH